LRARRESSTLHPVLRSFQNWLHHVARRSPRGFHPLLTVHYLTYACALRCPYCCDGHGRRYSDLRAPVLRTAQALELYARIRRRCDFLVVTGGEPLDHPDVDEILAALPRLRFDGVVLTTRGASLDAHLDALDAVPNLVVSLDTMDPAKGDAWLGVPGTHARVVENLARAVRRRKPASIVVSTVATPENLPDVAEVHRFARSLGVRHSVSPQLLGVHPHPALRESAEYRALMDGLVREKKAGGAVEGTVAYLEHLRDLRAFGCRPSTVMAVSPAGDVFYPCLELGHVAGNLLEEPDLDRIRAAGLEKFGPEPSCGPRCQSPCALGFALLFARPWIVLDEGWRTLLGAVRTSRRGARPA
jgi:MoaA/NifB/PqqE/SkfB family radical SAM enzyme